MLIILALISRSVEGQVYIPHAGRLIVPSTPTFQVTIAISPTGTITPTRTPRPTPTPSYTPSITPTSGNTPTITPTSTKTGTPTTTPTITPTPTDTIGDGVIVRHNHFDYVNDDGMVIIVGEVRNDSDANATNIRVIVTLYNNRTDVIDSLDVYTWLQVLRPTEKTCFEAVFLGNPTYNRYGFETLYANTDATPRALEIVSNGAVYLQDEGALNVFGQIRNTEPATSTNEALVYPQIVGTLYDEVGRVVDCMYVSAFADKLAPQETSIWEMTFRPLPADTAKVYAVQPK